MELDFCSFQIKIALNFKSQGTDKHELFSQGIYDSQNSKYETLAIADYEYAKISRIAVMDIKSWMKEDLDLHTIAFEAHSNLFIRKCKVYAKYFLLLAITSYQTRQNLKFLRIRSQQ